MELNLPQQPQANQQPQMPSMGAQSGGETRQQPAQQENPIPGFIENRMMQAAPQEKEFVKTALANGLQLKTSQIFLGL